MSSSPRRRWQHGNAAIRRPMLCAMLWAALILVLCVCASAGTKEVIKQPGESNPSATTNANKKETPEKIIKFHGKSVTTYPLTKPEACPDGRRVRKEISSLTDDELKAFVKGMKAMYEGGKVLEWVEVHKKFNALIHGTTEFLIFHRNLTYNFETDLLRLEPTLTGLPFWDPSNCQSDYEHSYVFQDNVLGALKPRDGCLGSPFEGLKNQDGYCIRREGNLTKKFWASRALATVIKSTTSYKDIGEIIENGQHGTIHNIIMGQMGGIKYSPMDPIFFPTHAGIDFLYAVWQETGEYPNSNYWKYDGLAKRRAKNGTIVRVEVNITDTIMKRPVRDVIDFRNTMCYEYEAPKLGHRCHVPSPVIKGSQLDRGANDSDQAVLPIEVPSGLTEEIIKEFQLNRTVVEQVEKLVHRVVAMLNDMQNRTGKAVGNLGDLWRENDKRNRETAPARQPWSEFKPKRSHALKSPPGNSTSSGSSLAPAVTAAVGLFTVALLLLQ